MDCYPGLEELAHQFFLSLALANTVLVAREGLEDCLQVDYQGESPDEVCLVGAASAYGYKLQARDQDQATLLHPDGSSQSYLVVEVLPFHPSRRRMSVVVRGAHTGRLLLLCKGADCSVLPLLRRSMCSREEEFSRCWRDTC